VHDVVGAWWRLTQVMIASALAIVTMATKNNNGNDNGANGIGKARWLHHDAFTVL
jgi:hypothetical protein